LIKCADKRPGELSGGEKQRVSLARAFLIPSELLLMDEPFSSLDTALKIRLTEVFARLWKSLPEKRTAVFVTHDLEEALMLADRIIVLKSGQVAADVSLKREVFPSAYAAPCEERQKLLSVLLEGEKC
ncbi:MAG: ATP-binding cassette domain-containing protein, partial [Christensenellaceae bacterium]